jgi:hypothetical protein
MRFIKMYATVILLSSVLGGLLFLPFVFISSHFGMVWGSIYLITVLSALIAFAETRKP